MTFINYKSLTRVNKSRIISILGCGWLGFPLAQRLIDEGFTVKGSTTSSGKISTLQNAGIDSYLVQLTPGSADELADSFFDCDVLFINIPPKGNPEKFVGQVKEIHRLIKKKEIKKVIFISSTSVYGEEKRAVTEDDEPTPETESGKAILIAERLLTGPDTTVIRFAGLVGPDRHPGRFFGGKTSIPNGNAPVNMIHLDDCIGIISAVISQEAFGITFNACSPDHPSKKEFYTLAAEKGGYAKPEFIDEKLSWKIVESKNLKPVIDYGFRIRNWNDWLSGL